MRLRNVAIFSRFFLLGMYCPVLHCSERFLFSCLSFPPSDEWVSLNHADDREDITCVCIIGARCMPAVI